MLLMQFDDVHEVLVWLQSPAIDGAGSFNNEFSRMFPDPDTGSWSSLGAWRAQWRHHGISTSFHLHTFATPRSPNRTLSLSSRNTLRVCRQHRQHRHSAHQSQCEQSSCNSAHLAAKRGGHLACALSANHGSCLAGTAAVDVAAAPLCSVPDAETPTLAGLHVFLLAVCHKQPVSQAAAARPVCRLLTLKSLCKILRPCM
jgi:hypothetical protein